MNNCKVLILTKVIITTLNAITGTLFTVTTLHKRKRRDIKAMNDCQVQIINE